MNIKKIRKQLKKINTLFSTIDEEGKANSIERDLMKTYILDLYEQVLSEGKTHDDKPTPKPKKAKKKVENVAKTESIFSENPKVSTLEEEALESIVEKEYKTIRNGSPSSASVESVIDLAEEVVELKEEANHKNEEPIQESDDRYDVLFQSDNSNELSSKLSKIPVADLNAAFGLNEKIYNINELFNGDNASYQTTIKALNEVSSMDEAKEYLSQNVIHSFGWLEDHKIKKAANFVKAIHRRYM